jgi:iron complex outermembrane recepter protein
VDATGPIDAEKTLLYRFNLGYTDADSFRDELFNQPLLIFPSLTWRPTENTDFDLNYEYRQEDLLSDSGIPVKFADGNNRIPPISIRNQFTEPGVHDENEYHLLDINASHRFRSFDTDWTARAGFQHETYDENFREISADVVQTDGRTLNRFAFFGDRSQDVYQAFAELSGKFQVWETKHTVLAGWDYLEREQDFPLFFDVAPPVDLFDPKLGEVDLAAIQARLLQLGLSR